MLPFGFHSPKKTPSPIFCCASAAPVISHGAFKVHNDPNRDIHDAIFHSFMAYAVRKQHKATLWALAMSHVQAEEFATPSESVLSSSLSASTQDFVPDQNLTKSIVPGLAVSPGLSVDSTQNVMLAPLPSTTQPFTPEKTFRGSLAPGLAAAFAEKHKRTSSSTTAQTSASEHNSAESMDLSQPFTETVVPGQDFKDIGLAEQLHQDLASSSQELLGSSPSTKLSTLDQDFKALRLLEKETQDLILPTHAGLCSSLLLLAHPKASITSPVYLASVSTPLFDSLPLGSPSVLPPSLLADSGTQATAIPVPGPPTLSFLTSAQPLPVPSSSILPTCPTQVPVMPSPVFNAEELSNNPLTEQTPYVIHLTSRLDYGPVYSHRYFVCPTSLQDDWVEISQLQWWAKGEPFKFKAEKWDLKCQIDSKFFRMTLRPNLSMRGFESQANTRGKKPNWWQ